MKRSLSYNIDKKAAGMSITKFLKTKGYSAKILTNIKKLPYSVLLNGRWAYMNEVLKEKDQLLITIPDHPANKDILPSVELLAKIKIVYEDEDIVVINKPHDMPTHPSINNYTNTLANALAAYYIDETDFVFRCINRLDRDTTGLCIIAKNPYAACVLSNMVSVRSIRREYFAIVSGVITQDGVVDAPIGRVSDSIIERHVDFVKGEHAVTHYCPVAIRNNTTLLSLWLETGRTHQIRVHMKYLGHPLIGDSLYNKEFPYNAGSLNRQALHAGSLKLKHPVTNKPLCFRAALPEDMAYTFIQTL